MASKKKVTGGKRPQNLRRTLGQFSAYLGRHRIMIGLVALLAAISALAALFGTYMIRPVVNGLLENGSKTYLAGAVGLTACIYIIGALSTLGYTQLMVRAAQKVLQEIRQFMPAYSYMRDIMEHPIMLSDTYVKKTRMDGINLADGSVKCYLDIDESYYYEMLSDLLGQPVESEYELLDYLEEASKMQKEYKKVLQAIDQVRQKGYGVVTPERSEIELEAPEVIRHGSKYGVKIKAKSPSIHMIRANIETEIAPIVGTKEQAEDLIGYIGQNEASDGIWDTNIFGKTVEQMVQDGITTKIAMIGEESQLKLQDSMQKIVNDTNGGLVCIII